MKYSDPRPMPAEVRRACRKPLRLTHLLCSHAYSNEDHLAVRDGLLEALVARFGEAEVFVGDKGRTQPVSSRVKSFKRRWVASIEFMLDVEDFGGREVTLPMLARQMEPRWQTWWATWKQYEEDLRAWSRVAILVLGDRQIRWVAAQIAREKLFRIDRQVDIDTVLPVIEAVERYCIDPSTETQLEMIKQNTALDRHMYQDSIRRGALWRAIDSKEQAMLANHSFELRYPAMEDAFSASALSATEALLPGVTRRFPRPFNWMRDDFWRFFTPTLLTDVG